MLKILLVLISIICSVHLNAQTGIGTTSPHASAKLEVAANNKGFLPPRVALSGANDLSTITTPATGLVVFNTATAGTTPNNVLPGYYYYDGTKWNQLVDQGSLNSFSGFVPNYAQSNASAVSKSAIGDIIVSQSITTSGRPVQIIATGDANPSTNSWVQLQLFRDGTAIGKKVQAESSSSNENVPYCLNFIDNPTTPGTYTYSVRIVGGGAGGFGFGESDGNHITLLELGAWSAGTMPVSKGGTGNSSFTTGSVMFSDGTNITQDNANLFWDDTNNRLGIGTNSPNSSAILDVSSTSKGVLIPRMTSTQRNAIDSPANGLQVFDNTTNSLWYFDGTSWVNSVAVSSYGDIKTGIQSGDHNGWVKLDGRLKSTLTSTQQIQASALGIGNNLPDATNAFLVQNGTTLASISSANTKTITQANLPNVNFTGTAESNGGHTHTINFNTSTPLTGSWAVYGGGAAGYTIAGNPTTSTSGAHTHTVSVASGGSGIALDITPKSLSVNTFIYLGY